MHEFIQPDPAWVSREIHGARIFSPNGTPVKIDQPNAGYVLERKVFDRVLSEMAAGAGADIIVKAPVVGITKDKNSFVNGVNFRYNRREYTSSAKIVIAADGVESQVGRWAVIDTTHDLRDVDVCALYLMAGIEIEPDLCDLYLGREIAPRGYIWVFPKGDDLANVGVGIGGTISGKGGKLAIDYLNEFVKKRFPSGKILAQVAGCVPVGDSLPDLVADGIMLIGDAAHHSDPISGGGIANAMFSGMFAAEAAIEGIRVGDVSAEILRMYQVLWDKDIGKNFKHICQIRDSVLRFSDELFDRCAGVLNKTPNKTIDIVTVFKTVLRHQPRLDVRLQQQGPLVLGRGVVEHLTQKRNQLGGQSHGRNTGAHDHHGVDDDEVLWRQRPARTQDLELALRTG